MSATAPIPPRKPRSVLSRLQRPRGAWRGLPVTVLRGAAVVALVCGTLPALSQGIGGGPANDLQGAPDAPRPDRARDAAPHPASGPAPDPAPEGQAGPPVIASDDPAIADVVMDGPSEPAGWQPADGAAAALPMGGGLPGNSLLPGGVMPLLGQFPDPAPQPQAPARPQAESVPAAMTSPVVVEMFTAQGCSSCPPADALLAELAGRPDVLPLAFHVDYWDYLGWADQFARPEFTARQQAYGRVTGERAIYTPQIIVDGADTLIDLGPATLESLIDAHQAAASRVAMRVEGAGGRLQVELWPVAQPAGPATVDLVRFVPRREVRITAGENRGRTIAYRNVVVSIERLATWDGRAPLRLTVSPGAGGAQPLPADTRHAVLVQKLTRLRGLGPILAAVPID